MRARRPQLTRNASLLANSIVLRTRIMRTFFIKAKHTKFCARTRHRCMLAYRARTMMNISTIERRMPVNAQIVSNTMCRIDVTYGSNDVLHRVERVRTHRHAHTEFHRCR
jgi:hypothetical protein